MDKADAVVAAIEGGGPPWPGGARYSLSRSRPEPSVTDPFVSPSSSEPFIAGSAVPVDLRTAGGHGLPP